MEPKKVIQALEDPSWIKAMQEELLQFQVQKMDVKSAFLYGTIEEEVYVCQPLGFEDPQFSDIRLQVQQKKDGIFISQDKYVANILKKIDFATVKTASTHMETNKALLKDEEAADVDVHLYRSMIGSLMYLTASRPDIMFAICACASNYAGASLDKKSTTGGCQFLRRRLISWQCKKQTIVANSTTEAKYVAAANCCGQSSGPIPFVTYETIIKEWEDIMERAATTASSLEAECQDTILGGAEAQIRFEAASKQFNNPPLSRVNTLGSREDNMKLKELMEFCTKLSVRALDLHKLMLPDITYYCWFWATAKAKTVNGERQIQAPVDKKKVIITEKSVRSDLMLQDVEGTECLPNDVIFEQLTLMGAKTTTWNEFSSTMASAIICLAKNQKFNFSKYIFDNMMKNLEVGVKFRMYPRKRFLWENHPSISNYDGSSLEDMSEDSAAPTDSHSTPIITQPSSSKPQNKKSRRKLRKDSGPTEPIPNLCTKLQKQVLDLEEAKTAQAKEIASLKKRVKPLEKEGSQELQGSRGDASKQGRKIADLDDDAEVTLINETQKRNDEDLMFDTDVLNGDEVFEDLIVNAAKTTSSFLVSVVDPVTTAGEVVTTANTITTVDELTL
ncbi:putative ribonuclease H-like domain-containing protein, partial [Tanacetum coccineum]